MKKFTVFANCQGEALAKTMMENKEFSLKYEWHPIPVVQSLTENDISSVLDIVRNSDLLIFQPIGATPNRPVELSSKYLVENVKESADFVSIPVLYFDGYFPHLGSLLNQASVLNKVHDYFIAYLYSIGIKKEEALEILTCADLYSLKQSTFLLNRSLKNLKEREKNLVLI